MPVQPHRFKQYLEGRGIDAAWWEEPALDGASRTGEASPYPWVTVRLGGHGLRRFAGGLRFPLKWGVRALFLSPLLILLRAALAVTNPWASDAVTVAFVLLVVGFFSLLCVYIFSLAVAYLLSSRRPEVELPSESAAAKGEISMAGLKLPAAAMPLADKRITLRGRVASIGDVLGPKRDLVARDLWLTGAAMPRRCAEAVDFAILAEGQQPLVVRLESAPMLLSGGDRTPEKAALKGWSQGEALLGEVGKAPGARATLFSLRAGQEVEITGVPSGEIVDVASFELGGRVRALLPDDKRPAAPYRSDAARPAMQITATPVTPVWVRAV